MFKRDDWWSTPIWVKDYSENEVDNKKIENICYSIKKRDAGVIISNRGGWQSNKVNIKEFGTLYDRLQKDLVEIFNDYSIVKEYEPLISKTWININNKEDYNIPHNHPGAFFSAVYYVKGSESGELVFYSNSINQWINSNVTYTQNKFVAEGAVYKPITNRLIVFPSWVPHEVKPTLSKEDRISIAFNILLAPAIK